jgi:NADPH2:quinone reductase
VAAASLLKGMTAEYLLRRTFRLEAGQTVLIHAAAGGVGLIACQWAAHLGGRVIGTVGSEAKAELARSHGCHHPIIYTQEDFPERVRELTDGQGVSVVYDSVGRETFDGSLACLAPRGMMVLFGQSSGAVPPFDPGRLARGGSLFLTRPSLFDYTRTRDQLLATATALFEILRQGAVRIEIAQEYPLSDVVRAHQDLESRHTTGSTVLRVD